MKMSFRCKNGVGLINYVDKDNLSKFEIIGRGQGIGETVRKVKAMQEG